MSLGDCHPHCSNISPVLGARDIAKLVYRRNPIQQRRRPQRHVLRYEHGRWCRKATSRQPGRTLVLQRGVLRTRDSGSSIPEERFPGNAASSLHRYGQQAIEAVASGDCGIEDKGIWPESFLGVRRTSSGSVRHLQEQENQTMLRQDRQRVVLAGTLALLLSACGGGTGSMDHGTGTMDGDTFTVNAAQARTLTGAGEPDFPDGDVAAAPEGQGAPCMSLVGPGQCQAPRATCVRCRATASRRAAVGSGGTSKAARTRARSSAESTVRA